MKIPTEMRAIEIQQPGGPEVLVPARRPVPQPAKGEVLIRVAAAGVNRPDVLQRQGGYAPPPGASDLPGLEVAGEIVALGPDTPRWKVGDTVAALVAGGGYAEYCPAPSPQCLPIPGKLDMVEAAALPETFFTVWTNVFDRGRLKAGESFLVHGGSSGIGTTAIQLASRSGSRVFATAGSADKCSKCKELGAIVAVDYKTEDFVQVIERETGGKGVDVILDMVGGDYIARNLKCLAVEGRLVQIAFLKGAKAEVNFAGMMMKRQTITGSTLRPQSVAAKGAIARALEEKVWPLIAAGEVLPQIHATFPLDQAAEAHRLMESSAHVGKIVLTL
ncbi:NAD(P)H-quinone oxidoreductase [Dongia deserti]|uniref:NAD(P)H-quinone oxidoreductase n=1 Tax=Dongia deserti TaxID=2268030 RepID=UPI0025498708|nr:NAD(P)H-quinone oxidoreductase [Dongia deserti]